MKKAQRKVLNVEIVYDDVEDLQQLQDSEQFNNLILQDAFEVVEKAVGTKKKAVPIVNIPNLGLEVSIERNNFKPILQKALQYYIQQEQYERCEHLTKLIDTL
jgi:hypothetical protein